MADTETEKGVKRELEDRDRDEEENDQENGENRQKKRRIGEGSQIECRILLPSKVAGAIIGKGGTTIKRFREEFNAHITLPDSRTSERILVISATTGSICDLMLEVLPIMKDEKDTEIRLLIHQSQAGCIIGKGGNKIKDLRDQTGANIKVFGEVCPNSTERVCAIGGSSFNIIADCLSVIFGLLDSCPIKGYNNPYDPTNSDEYRVQEYGGYSASNERGGRGGGGRGGGRGDRRGRDGGGGRRNGGGRDRRGGRGGGGGRDGGRRDSGGRRGGHMRDNYSQDMRRGGNQFGSNNFEMRGGGGGGRNQDYGGMGGRMDTGRNFDGRYNYGNDSAPRNQGFGSGRDMAYSSKDSYSAPDRGFTGYGDRHEFSGGRDMYSNSRDHNDYGNSRNTGGGYNKHGDMGGQGIMFTGTPSSGGNMTQVSIPRDLAGAVIGKGGNRIRQIREESGAKISISDQPGAEDRIITINGSPEQIQNAQFLLQMSVKNYTAANRY